MAQLRQVEHLDEPRVFIVESLAQSREVVLGELPVLALRRFPVIGRHRGRLRPSRAAAGAWVIRVRGSLGDSEAKAEAADAVVSGFLGGGRIRKAVVIGVGISKSGRIGEQGGVDGSNWKVSGWSAAGCPSGPTAVSVLVPPNSTGGLSDDEMLDHVSDMEKKRRERRATCGVCTAMFFGLGYGRFKGR